MTKKDKKADTRRDSRFRGNDSKEAKNASSPAKSPAKNSSAQTRASSTAKTQASSPAKSSPRPLKKKPMTSPAKTKPPSSKSTSSKPTSPKPTSSRTSKASLKSRKILELKRELRHLNEKKEEGQLIKDAKGRRYCHDEHCDQPAVTDIYCRYHYLALWKYIQQRKKLLRDKYLLKTTEQLIQSFGAEALNLLIRDMKSEKSFESALREMNFSHLLLKEDSTLSSTAERTDF